MEKLDFTFKYIEQNDDYVLFVDCYDRRWKLEHTQECCEEVFILDVCGDWADILNEIVYYDAIEEQNDGGQGSETWSFYKFRTRLGEVVVRFYGTSNGYYSETATLRRA